MKASFTSRIHCSVLAATLVALPCHSSEAHAAQATAPTAPATPPATGTTPTTGTPEDSNRGVDGTGAITAPGETPTEVPGETPAEAAEPTPEPPPPEVIAPPAPPPAPVGPQRPPEPTVANGKYKAKGTGLMIAGGSLFGLGIAGVITSFFLTKCDEPANSFACKNKQNNTFSVPATAAAALLGAVLLSVGIGYRVRYKKWENWKPTNTPPKTAVYPTLLRGGAGVGYTLNF